MRVSALGIGLSLIFIGCTSFVHPPRVPHQRSSSSYDTNRCGIVGRRSPPATSSVSHIRSVEATAGGVVPDVYILSEVLAGVVVAASEAGAHMKAKIGADVLKTKFNPKDLLTEVDSECQGIIERVMSHEFPEHALLGEESVEPGSEASAAALQHALANPGGEESDGADWLWIVDPIDGTTNFVHGMPLSAVSIGVAYRGQVVVGCIYDPFRDELFTATRGNGAFLNGLRMTVGAQTSIEEATVACGAPPGILALGPCVRGMAGLAPHVRTTRMLGSAGKLYARYWSTFSCRR